MGLSNFAKNLAMIILTIIPKEALKSSPNETNMSYLKPLTAYKESIPYYQKNWILNVFLLTKTIVLYPM